jgi:hypothetical protein
LARYFFHVEDGKVFRDEQGAELADLKAVRAEAIRASGEMLRDNGIDLWDGEDWAMYVVDAAGEPVLTLRFSATQHAGQEVAA